MNFSKASSSSKLTIVALAVLLVGTSFTLLGAQQNQENRSRASGPTTPVVDSSTSARGSFTSSLTFPHVMSVNPNRLLVVAVSLGSTSTTVNSVTYGGSPLTKIARKSNNTTAEELWYLAGVTPTGTNNVVVSLSGTVGSVVAGSASFYNVNQSVPYSNVALNSGGFSTKTNVTVGSTNTNQLVLDALSTYLNVSATVNTGQSQLWNMPGNGSASTITLGAGSIEPAAASSTQLGWKLSTYRSWAEIAIAINPAPVPTATLAPTNTPVPTATPVPTDTPTPTATPTPIAPTATPTPVPAAAAPVLCPACNFTSYVSVGNRLSGYDFTNAFFAAVYAPDQNLSNSNFTSAAFNLSTLTNTNLSNSNFTNVDFSGVDLTGATTTGATFTGAVWSNTTCPDGTNSDNDGGTCAGHGI